MLSRTLTSGSSRTVWKVRAIRLAAICEAWTVWNGSPSKRISPEVSGVSRVTAPRRVLLPEPFGPMIP
jgi:hypothetical protein